MPAPTPLPVALAALRYSLRDLNQTNEVMKDAKGESYVLLVHATRGDTVEISYHNDRYNLHISKPHQSGMETKVLHSLEETMKELGADAKVLAKVDKHLKTTQERYDAHMQATSSFKM